MQTFTDSLGREWLVRLTVGKIASIYERLGLSIYMLIENDQAELRELLDNWPLLANVVYLLCRRQAREMRVSPSDFARGIGEIESMQQAFLAALVRFFPQPDPKRQKNPGPTEPRTHDYWEKIVLEAAGVANMDPLKHSLRTIHLVASGRQSDAWWHTAHMIAHSANLHRDRKKKGTPYTAAECNPYLLAQKGEERKRTGTALIGSVVTGMFAPDKAGRFQMIIEARNKARETNDPADWAEFKRLAEGSS